MQFPLGAFVIYVIGSHIIGFFLTLMSQRITIHPNWRATVYRGILGYGAIQRMHESSFLGLTHDLTLMITIVDSEEKIGGAVKVPDEMVDEGLAVLSDVEVIKRFSHMRQVR
jgi:PII-like signaling protein